MNKETIRNDEKLIIDYLFFELPEQEMEAMEYLILQDSKLTDFFEGLISFCLSNRLSCKQDFIDLMENSKPTLLANKLKSKTL